MPSRIQRELALLVTGKDVSATRTLRGVDRQVSALERHTGKAARNMGRNIERGIVIGATAAAGAIGYAVKQAMDWESAFAGVRKTVEGTPEQLQAIADGIRNMSREMPVSAIELAAIAEAAGALGVAREDILEFTRTVAMIGATTDVTTDQAATALGQLGNVIGLTSVDYRGFAAALVDLGNKGASTEAQILEVARRSGGAAKLVGIAKDETLGWAAAAANLGMGSELAGTSLQRMYLTLMPAFNAGTKELREVTGQTAAQLKRAFKQDASGAIESFLGKLGKLPKDKRLKAVQDIFGKGTGLTRLVLGLADSVDKNLTPALDNSTHAWGEGTAAAEEYQKRLDTTESQLTIFKNSIDDAAVTIGANLLPMLAELAQEGTAWIDDHQTEIAQFGRDLADGLRDAVKWAQSLDWEAITGTIKAGAGLAKGIVEAFTNAPPWVQQFLAAGFVANKFTGGVIGDVIGELGKGLIKGVLGINAAVVNVNGGVVNGVPGKGGGPNVLPAAGGFLAPGAGAVAAVGLSPFILAYGIPELFKALGITKLGGDERGAVAGKLGGSTPAATTQTLERLTGAMTATAASAATRAAIAEAGRNRGGLTGDPALRTVQNDPTGFLNSSAMRSITQEQAGTTRAVDKVQATQTQQIIALAQSERTASSGFSNVAALTSAGAATAAAATGASASRIVGAIAANRPILNVTTNVQVTGNSVQTAVTQRSRVSPSTSRERDKDPRL